MRAGLLALAVLLAACGREPVAGLGEVTTSADAGDPDAGLGLSEGGPIDAQVPGPLDGSSPVDAGTEPPDTGVPGDAGVPEDGAIDLDAGSPTRDGGRRDGGTRRDGGGVDAGTPDAGTPDAGCTIDGECAPDHCDVATGTCVECRDSMDCGRARVCDLSSHVCRFPCFNGQCGPGRVCDPVNDVCVECLSDTECAPDVCDQTTRTCVECNENAQCTDVVGRPVCDTDLHACVECRGGRDCGPDQICDTDLHACVSAAGRALCEPCSEDSECGSPGDLCVGYIGGIDRSCSPDCSAPGSTCPRGFECVSVREGTALVCRPRYAMRNPTCTAVRHLGDPCPFSASDTDPGCGVPNFNDARCIAVASGGGLGVCTIFCDRDAQCPTGFTCTGAGPNQTGACL